MATKKLKYTAELGEEFIEWNAAQNVIGEDGKVPSQDWRSEISKIKSCLLFSKTSKREYALNECPERWNEFLAMKQGLNKPEVQEYNNEDYYDYLDTLRDSGATNMFGAAPYLQEEFPNLTEKEASKILIDWMDSFNERHSKQSQ